MYIRMYVRVILCSTIILNSMSLKAPFIVEEAKKALAEGHSVVIGLQTTGEVRNTT